MCGRSCVPNCVCAFGVGIMVSAFCKSGVALFLVGLSAVILSFALRAKR